MRTRASQGSGRRGPRVKTLQQAVSCTSCERPSRQPPSGFCPGGRLVEDPRQIEDHHPLMSRDLSDRLHYREQDAGERIRLDRLYPPGEQRPEVALELQFETPARDVPPDRLARDEEDRQKTVLCGGGVEWNRNKILPWAILNQDLPSGLVEQRPNDLRHIRNVERLEGRRFRRAHANLRRFQAGTAGR